MSHKLLCKFSRYSTPIKAACLILITIDILFLNQLYSGVYCSFICNKLMIFGIYHLLAGVNKIKSRFNSLTEALLIGGNEQILIAYGSSLMRDYFVN